jgi:excisionase family DNA binding protein
MSIPAPALPLAPERLLTAAEVAALFRVDPKTVSRWAAQGKIDSIRTLGGHRRFRESDVRPLLAAAPQVADGGRPGEWPARPSTPRPFACHSAAAASAAGEAS